MRLSKNFLLKEFTKSFVADRLGIDNTPPPEVIENLRKLAVNICQRIRDEFDVPLKINSGYRCPALNKKVGGAKTSSHVKGEAVDCEFASIPNQVLYDWIKDNLDFDQLILEYHNPKIPDSGWVHVSFRAGNNRKQALKINK